MNIFVLHETPELSATYHCDKHVVKMIVETAQLLSVAHHIYNTPQKDFVYKRNHEHHPCTKWVCRSKDNYVWAFRLLNNLLLEYTLRYKKIHKTTEKVSILENIPEKIPNIGLTPFVLVMPEEYRNPNPVTAYRTYYDKEKRRFARWKCGSPDWWVII